MINQMSLDKVELVKFISYDGKVYKFGSDIIERWQECYVKSLAMNYLKKQMEVTIDENGCIVISESAKYLDSVFETLMYKNESEEENRKDLLDKFSIKPKQNKSIDVEQICSELKIKMPMNLQDQIHYVQELLIKNNIQPRDPNDLIKKLFTYLNKNKFILNGKHSMLHKSMIIDESKGWYNVYIFKYNDTKVGCYHKRTMMLDYDYLDIIYDEKISSKMKLDMKEVDLSKINEEVIMIETKYYEQ